MLPAELSAIFHSDENKYEFIYGPILKDESLNREFSFLFNGLEFRTYFGKPTQSLEAIAVAFREIGEKSDTDYRNLKIFRDYYKRDKLPAYVQKYFEGKEPISFFIEGDFRNLKEDISFFCKHVNFYLKFYDRKKCDNINF